MSLKSSLSDVFEQDVTCCLHLRWLAGYAKPCERPTQSPTMCFPPLSASSSGALMHFSLPGQYSGHWRTFSHNSGPQNEVKKLIFSKLDHFVFFVRSDPTVYTIRVFCRATRTLISEVTNLKFKPEYLVFRWAMI